MTGSTSSVRPPTGGARLGWVIVAFAVLCVAIAPPGGFGSSMLSEWHDQQVFLQATTQTLEQGLPDAQMQALVGPAYIGLTLAVGRIFGLDPAAALLLLSRLTFVACAIFLATVALRHRLQASLGFQAGLALVAVLALASSVWVRFPEVPWTHFVAAALLGAMVLTSLSGLPLAMRSALLGLLAVVLLQTRLFEAMVAAIAAVLILPMAAARYRGCWREWPGLAGLRVALPFVVGGAIGYAAVGLSSHNWSIYQQYGDQEGMALAPQLAPIKAVQLFWDTCFATICEYARSTAVSPLIDGIDSWRQPLPLQLPGLIGALAGSLTLLALRPRLLLQLPLGILFAMLAAGGLVLAYVFGAPSGSPHLKYGFFRDFVPPLILLSCALIGALAATRTADGRSSGALVAPMVVCIAVVVALTGLRAIGLPQVPGAAVARFEIASSCEAGGCSFSLLAVGESGETMPYPDLAFVSCARGKVAPPIQRVSELRLDRACGRVGILPLASGLLYTPEGEVFFKQPLDLTLGSDTVSVPPQQASPLRRTE
jgi:hypothetical protein